MEDNSLTLDNVINQQDNDYSIADFARPEVQNQFNTSMTTMSDAIRQQYVNADTINRLRQSTSSNKPQNSWVGTAKEAVKTTARTAINLPSDVWDGINLALKNSDWWSPNMTQEQRDDLMLATTMKYRARKANEQWERQQSGADNMATDIVSTVADVVSDIAVVGGFSALGGPAGTLAGKVIVGAKTGAREFASGMLENASKEYEYSGDLKNFDSGKVAKLQLANAAIQSWIEYRLGAERVFDGVVKDAMKRGVAREIGKTMVSEGIEEGLQDWFTAATNWGTGYEDRTVGEVFNDSLKSAALGAIIGGFIGTPMYLHNRSKLAKNIKRMGDSVGIKLDKETATQIATDHIDGVENAVLNEMKTLSELRNHYGVSHNTLVDMIKDVYNTNHATFSDELIEGYARKASNDIIYNAQGLNMPVGEYLEYFAKDSMSIHNGALFMKPISNIEEMLNDIKYQKKVLQKQVNVDNTAKIKYLQNQIKLLENYIGIAESNKKINRMRQRRQAAQVDLNDFTKSNPQVAKELKSIQQANYTDNMDTFTYVGGVRVPTNYEVVSAKTINQSHINGEVNPNYSNKALQNRSRANIVDSAVLQNRATNFQPEKMLKSADATTGAPIVNEQGDVISGNGRTDTLARAKTANPQAYELYKQRLQELGYNIDGIEDPILVRRVSGLSESQQVAVAEASNFKPISEFQHAAQAVNDGKSLTANKIMNPQELFASLPNEEKQAYVNTDGSIDQLALDRRFNDAVMARILGTENFENLVLGGRLNQKVVQGISSSVKNGLFVVADANPEFYILEDLSSAVMKSAITTKNNFLDTVWQSDLAVKNPAITNAMLYELVQDTQNGISNFLSDYASRSVEHKDQKNGLFKDSIGVLSQTDIARQSLIEIAKEAGKVDENGVIKDDANLRAVFVPAEATADNTIEGQQQQDLLFQESLAPQEYTEKTIDIDGVQKSAVNSEGNYLGRTEEEIRNFYKWFGDSKVVDEEGKPLVVYHGTDAEFNTFDKNKGYSATDKTGSWFSDTLDIPEQRQKDYQKLTGKSGVLYPVYLSIQNPLITENRRTYNAYIAKNMDIDFSQETELKNFITDELKGGDSELDFTLSEFNNYAKNKEKINREILSKLDPAFSEELTPYVRQALKDFDGAIIENDEGRGKSFVAFEPNQIKSVENRGTFSSDTGNIYYQSAFAGSRVDYDRPSLEAIGSGEGNQAHGYGLYYALNKDVADSSKQIKAQEDRLLSAIEDDKNEIKNLEEYNRNKGQVHEVDIPEMENLLDEQKPFSKQSDFVKNALIKLAKTETNAPYQFENQLQKNDIDAKDIYNRLSNKFGGDDKASQILEKYGIKGITYYGKEDGRCFVIFNPDDVQVVNKFYQGNSSRYNGYFDKKLSAIVIGSNANEGTFLHETSHFFLEENFKIWKEGTAPKKWMDKFDQIANILGITQDQDELTTEQQENWAYMTEAYLFGKGTPEGRLPFVTEFLKWAPAQYQTIEDIGYRDAEGKIHNPVLTKEAMDVMDRLYSNGWLTDSPQILDFTNEINSSGKVVPVNVEREKERMKELDNPVEEPVSAQYNLKDMAMSAGQVIEETKTELWNEVIEEREATRPEEKPTFVQRVFAGRGTNTQAQMQADAQKWIKDNPVYAKQLLEDSLLSEFTDGTWHNDSGIDPTSLLLTYAEMNKGSLSPEKYNEIVLKAEVQRSIASKSAGLTNFHKSMFLDGYNQVLKNKNQKVALARYGKVDNAVELLNKDIQDTANKWATKLSNTEQGSIERQQVVAEMLADIKEQFGIEDIDGDVLYQEDLHSLRNISKSRKQHFINKIKGVIRKHAGLEMTTAEQNALTTKAREAQKAIDTGMLDSKDLDTVKLGAKKLYEYQTELDKYSIKPTAISNFVGAWMPKATLSRPSTHIVNIASNTFQMLSMRATNRAFFGANIVDKGVIEQAKQRYKAIFEESGVNMAQISKTGDKTLIGGEYTPQKGADNKWYDTFGWLAAEDNFFRNDAFFDYLAHRASQVARKNGQGVEEANRLFGEYIKVNNNEPEILKIREEAVNAGHIAVFTNDTKFAQAMTKIKRAVDDITAIRFNTKQGLYLEKGGKGLGTILMPFVKTPANVIYLGAEMLANPVYNLATLNFSKFATDWNLQRDSIALGMSAMIVAALMSAGEYKPSKSKYDDGDVVIIGGIKFKLNALGPMAQPVRQLMTIWNGVQGKNKGINDWINTGLSELPAFSALSDFQTLADNQVRFATNTVGSVWGQIVPGFFQTGLKIAGDLGAWEQTSDKTLKPFLRPLGGAKTKNRLEDTTDAMLYLLFGNYIKKNK